MTAYDADSNVIETRETDVSQILGVPNEIFLTTNFYDSLNRLQETVDNLGETTYYRYDSRNNLVATADADGPAGPTITRRAFTNGDLTVNTTNLFGNVTLYYLRRPRPQGPRGAGPHRRAARATASTSGRRSTASRTTPSAPESFPPTPDPTQGGGDGIIRTGWNYDKDSLLSSMIDDNGNVTLYLYDDLNRQVLESEGLVVGSTYTEANILGARVIPTPTAATIDNPATIPDSEINAQLAEAQALIAAVAPLFPTAGQPGQRQPADHEGLGLLAQQQRPDQPGRERLRDVHQVRRHRPPDRRPDLPRRPERLVHGRPDLRAGPGLDPARRRANPTVVQGTTIQNFQYDGLSRMTYAFDNNDPTTASRRLDRHRRLRQPRPDHRGGADHRRPADPGDLLGLAGRRPAQRADLPQRPRRGLHLRQPRPAQDRLRPGGVAADRHLRLHRRGPGARAALPAERHGRDLPRTTPGPWTSATTACAGRSRMRDLRSDNSLIVGFTYTYDRMGNKLTEGKLHDPGQQRDLHLRLGLPPDHLQPGGGRDRAVAEQLDAGRRGQLDPGQRPVAAVLVDQRADPDAPAAGGPATVLYDNNGNETDDGTYLYTYDALEPAEHRDPQVRRRADRRLLVRRPGPADPEGRHQLRQPQRHDRLRTTTAQQDIEEHNGAGTLTQQYVYGNGINEPLVLDRNLNGDATATGPGDQRLFYYQNALGSVYALTDTSGQDPGGLPVRRLRPPDGLRPGPERRRGLWAAPTSSRPGARASSATRSCSPA